MHPCQGLGELRGWRAGGEGRLSHPLTQVVTEILLGGHFILVLEAPGHVTRLQKHPSHRVPDMGEEKQAVETPQS